MKFSKFMRKSTLSFCIIFLLLLSLFAPAMSVAAEQLPSDENDVSQNEEVTSEPVEVPTEQAPAEETIPVETSPEVPTEPAPQDPTVPVQPGTPPVDPTAAPVVIDNPVVQPPRKRLLRQPRSLKRHNPSPIQRQPSTWCKDMWSWSRSKGSRNSTAK